MGMLSTIDSLQGSELGMYLTCIQKKLQERCFPGMGTEVDGRGTESQAFESVTLGFCKTRECRQEFS